MKIINNNIYLTYQDCLDAGIKEGTLKSARATGAKDWVFIKDEADKRRLLLQYDTLKLRYKDLVLRAFGNDLYEYIALDIIKSNLISKQVDIDLIRSYQYGDGKFLTDTYIQKYIDACKYLYLLERIGVKDAKELGFDNKKMFNDSTVKLIKKNDVSLPKAWTKLNAKVKAYKDADASVVISKKFGNPNARKMAKDELQKALLQQLFRVQNNWSYAKIKKKYNEAVKMYNDMQKHLPEGERDIWKKVSLSSIRSYMVDNGETQFLSLPAREGTLTWRRLMGIINELEKPSQALRYTEVDGWDAELAYQTRDKKGILVYHKRMKLILVVDGFNNYPVGFAICDKENVVNIKSAWRNALTHLKQITGEYYKFEQIKADRFGLKQMTNFYEGITHLFTPAQVGNPNSKGIESRFSYLNTEYCNEFLNWTGHNISGGNKRQPNFEFKQKVRKQFPTRDIVIEDIKDIIRQEREKLFDDYMASFNKLSEDDKSKLRMTRHQFLLGYGETTGDTRRLTGRGLQVTIGGTVLFYDTFDTRLRKLAHIDWEIHYDLTDLSNALAVSSDGAYQLMVEYKTKGAKAINDQTEAQRQEMQRRRNLEKEWKKEIAETGAHNMKLLISAGLEDAVLLKAPMTDSRGQHKHRLQDGRDEDTKEIEEKTMEIPKSEMDSVKEQLKRLKDRSNRNEGFDAIDAL